jgi:hypothetical protein
LSWVRSPHALPNSKKWLRENVAIFFCLSNTNDRKEFVEALSHAWQTLRKNYIGGTAENLCWEAYNDAKDIHPTISFSNISDSFLMRCNMGLAYIK